MVKFVDALYYVHYAAMVENYALITLITYLTDVWGLGLIHAAGLINIWIGTTKLMPFVFIFAIDNYVRNSYSMLIFSSTSSALGMGLLSVSTSSWISGRRLVTGACNGNTMKCVSETQQLMFYFGLICIMIGRSAREATMETIQFRGNVFRRALSKCYATSIDKKRTFMFVFLFSIIGSWSIRFGISAAFSFVALYLLMGKSWSHKLDINKPEMSPVTTVVRVFLASFYKVFKEYVVPYDDSSSTYKDLETGDPEILLTKYDICSQTERYGHNSWIHCSGEEVEDTKALVKLLPVGVVFVFLGLISSMGNTFFVRQGDRLDASIISPDDLCVSQLFLIHEFWKNQYGKYTLDDLKPTSTNPSSRFILDDLKNKFTEESSRYTLADLKNTFTNESIRYTLDKLKTIFTNPYVLLFSAMIYAILCCLAAALVEVSRLYIIRNLDLENKTENIIPMSTFWLVPQFFFLGIVDGDMERSMCLFFIREMPWRMRNYGILVSKGFVGLGTIGSVLFVYVIGKISEIGGKPSWFQHNMENSRLDLFYWLLMALCFVILVTWIVLNQSVNFALRDGRPFRYEAGAIENMFDYDDSYHDDFYDIHTGLLYADNLSTEDGEIRDNILEAVSVEHIVNKLRKKIK